MAFSRDGRTLYFRSGENLFAAPINLPTPPAAQAGRRKRPEAAGVAAAAVVDAARRRPTTPDAAPNAANATARQVTYTANLEVDHKALRAQVFNEGWRIMKNRFYDAEDARRELERGEGDVRAAAREHRRRGRSPHDR